VNAVVVKAFAKINLSLEVLGKRPDGYHEIRSVIQSIDLADKLSMTPGPELFLECSLSHLAADDNLVMKAARVLQRASSQTKGAYIRLEKRIPQAAGLGGASADAAATLVGLDYLWGLGMPYERLVMIATELGSDVPFFLTGGTAMVEGRGEVVHPLPDIKLSWLVMLVPEHTHVSKTATLYRMLGSESWTSGERARMLAEAISRNQPLDEELLCNAFEGVADRAFPQLPKYREALSKAGAKKVHLSGAGPALFALFTDELDAAAVAERLRDQGFKPLVTRTLSSVEARPSPQIN